MSMENFRVGKKKKSSLLLHRIIFLNQLTAWATCHTQQWASASPGREHSLRHRHYPVGRGTTFTAEFKAEDKYLILKASGWMELIQFLLQPIKHQIPD